ncbi:MAG TPA: hypothetical protein VK054_06260 [Beutenbergiaceae bacterium]|nr:hypothetical protein [Beutenbergiaceae bacterium]
MLVAIIGVDQAAPLRTVLRVVPWLDLNFGSYRDGILCAKA